MTGAEQTTRGAAGVLDGAAMEQESSRWLPRLTRLLDEQMELCRGLESLSEAQSNAVSDGDAEALLRVLGERQTIIDRVGEINMELETFRSRRERVLARLSVAERAEVEGRIESIAKAVGSVCERDERDRRELQSQRDEVSKQLGGIGKSRGAVAAYGAGVSAGVSRARFQDRSA